MSSPDDQRRPAAGLTPRGKTLWKRLFLMTAGLLVLATSKAVYDARARHDQLQKWTEKLEEQGARVILAGYGGTGLLGRIPIIREFAIQSSFEVFLPNTETAQRVLSDLHKAPDLGRIWVHINNVNKETRQKIEEEFPEVQINGYTMAGE